MLNLIEEFRRNNAPHMFLLPIFDSQTCEKTFRQLRSMGTVNFTKINFSLYEIFHMIGRIELQNHIAYFKLSEKNVLYKRRQKTTVHGLPSHDEVERTLEDAKKAAIADAKSLGIDPENFDQYEFKSRVSTGSHDQTVPSNILLEEDLGENDSIDINDDNSVENSPFTTIIDENGKEMMVRKSTLVWMLSERSISISNDRLRRVQVSNLRN